MVVVPSEEIRTRLQMFMVPLTVNVKFGNRFKYSNEPINRAGKSFRGFPRAEITWVSQQVQFYPRS